MIHSTPRAGAEPQVKRARQRATASRVRPSETLDDVSLPFKNLALLSVSE